MNREAIYAALFTKLDYLQSVETKSRILAHWDDVSPNMQPALYMTCTSQIAEQRTGFPAKYFLDAKIYIYAHRDTAGDVPSTILNTILDEIDSILAPNPNPTFKQTLDGLVEHCWVNGNIETDEGTLGNQAVAIVPIRILTTT